MLAKTSQAYTVSCKFLAHNCVDRHARASGRRARSLMNEELKDQTIKSKDQELKDQESKDQELKDQKSKDQALEDQELNDKKLEDQELEDKEFEDEELDDKKGQWISRFALRAFSAK